MRRPPTVPSSVWIVLLALTSIAWPGIAHAVVQQITTSIATNTSWGLPGSGSTVEADVFWVRNSINVNSGVTLTVKSGVVVKFDPGVYLAVQGALQSQGTNAGNVILTSSRDDAAGGDTNGDGGGTLPNASDWQSIYFTSVSPDTSRLTFTQVRYAGSGSNGGVTFTNVTGRITNCTFQQCYTGISLAGTANPIVLDSNVQQSSLTPVVLDPNCNPVFTNFTFSSGNNGYDAWGVRGTNVSGTATLPKRGATVGATPLPNVSYVLLGSFTVNAGSTLNLAAGITLKMIGGASVSVNGTLNMSGTSTDTISVTSVNDDNLGFPRDTNNNGSSTTAARNDWNGLYWNPGATGTMSYCRVRFGNTSVLYGMIDLTNVNLPITNSVLSDAGHGVVAHGTSAPTLNTVTIANCSSTPTSQSLTAAPTYTNLTFTANALTGLGLIGEPISVATHLTQQTVAGYANITYVMLYSGLTVNSPGSLLIDPGVVIKFTSGTGIYVFNAFDAEGTALAPITFTSWKDDTYGNPADTNGDAAATTPAAGDWNHIYFDDTSVDASCKLTNDRILYGSVYPYYASVYCARSSPTITGNTISRCVYAVRFEGPSAPNFSNNNVSYCQYAPVLMSAMADPTMTGNTFTNCGINGIALISETLTQSATLKYRSTVTFPPPNQTTVFAYVPTGGITVPAGMTLTIQPQVVIKPYGGGGTWFDIFGSLNAVGGTGANRIVFTSIKDDGYAGDTNADAGASAPAAGNWGSIYFEDSSVDAACVVRNVLVQFGSTTSFGAITTVNASPKLAAIDFFQNGTGLTCAGTSAPSCDSLNLSNSTYLPIVLSLASTPSFAHMTFANNAWTALGLLGETVTQNVTLSPRVLGTGLLNPMVYIPTGNITIGSGATWTISPGTIIKLGRQYYDPFGTGIEIDGALNASGTAVAPIEFTSTADDAIGGDTHGDGSITVPGIENWAGIAFTAGSNAAASAINYCRFAYGGWGGSSALSMQSVNVPVSNSRFTICTTALGIYGNAAPTVAAVQIDTCTVPIRMSLVSNPTYTNVNFVNCTYTAIGVVNETLAQDALWRIRPISGRLNMPYLVDGALGVGPGATLTMQPGVIVKLVNGSLDINKAFFAVGRTIPESLVVFTSYRDDSYGGRTWVNPNNTTPSMGDWTSITIEGTAIDASVVFRDCVVRYGNSSSTNGAIRCVNSSPTIDSTLVNYNGCGVSVEGASNPLIRGSSLYGNAYYAVNNTGGAFCVAATGDYWGAASGPNDASATADLCGTASNAGSGDAVSQNVDYSGYVTAGILSPLLGDVSLNGSVRAYDASLVLQYLAASLTLGPLQKLVANVDNSAAIDNTDASLILQFVAGLIPALPGNATRLKPLAPADAARVEQALRRLSGSFTLRAGAPRRVGDTWELPVLADGTGDILGAEVALAGGAAGTLAGVRVAGGAMEAHGVADGVARLAMASATPLPAGEIATLVFPASGADWSAPAVAFARVNRDVVTPDAADGPAPAKTFFALPWPNPAAASATLRLGVSTSEAGARARVTVFDVTGRRVRTVLEQALPAGVHVLRWDLRDESGHPAAPGIYLVRAETGAFRSVQRLVVVRGRRPGWSAPCEHTAAPASGRSGSRPSACCSAPCRSRRPRSRAAPRADSRARP